MELIDLETLLPQVPNSVFGIYTMLCYVVAFLPQTEGKTYHWLRHAVLAPAPAVTPSLTSHNSQVDKLVWKWRVRPCTPASTFNNSGAAVVVRRPLQQSRSTSSLENGFLCDIAIATAAPPLH